MSASKPEIVSVSSLNSEVAQSYYATTAKRSHSSTRAHYQNAADGLSRRLRPWIPSDRSAKCLDLACGCGELIFLLERMGFENTAGVDLCEEELAQARGHVSGQLTKADVLDHLVSLESGSLDLITALNLLEHLSKDKLLAVLKECRRVLRPGGTLVAMVPNAVSPFGSLTRHWDITHEWAFTTNNFRQLARLVGFADEIEFRECGPEVHGVISGIRFVLWQFLRAALAFRFLIELGTTKDRIYTMDMLVRLRNTGR